MSANVGEAVEHGDVSLSDYKGKKYVVLSFHIFDFTGG